MHPVLRVGADGKPLDPKPTYYGFRDVAFDSVMAAAGEHVLLLGRAQAGKLYYPNAVYGIFLDVEGKGVANDNPGRPMCYSGRKYGYVGPMPVTLCAAGDDGAGDVFSPAVAGNGEWFLALHQEVANISATQRWPLCRPVIWRQLLDARTGKVVEDGMLTAAGAREKTPNACGGPAGEFLLVYERNDDKEPNQRVCARIVKVK
jgi:hypothetical protein